MSGDALRCLPPRVLLVADQSGIFAQGFEPAKLTTAGELRSLIPGSQFVGPLSGMTFSASQTGLLAYPSPRERQSQFTWFDETGKLIRRVGKPGTYVTFGLSNDGSGSPLPGSRINAYFSGSWTYNGALSLSSRSKRRVRETLGG